MTALNAIRAIHKLGPGTDHNAPKTLDKAQRSANWTRWERSYREELDSLKKMGVWKLVSCEKVCPGKKVFKGWPIFSIKHDKHGEITWLKTRHVLQGFLMVQGRDYEKTTSPTARAESWQILLHLAAKLDWNATQVNIKTAFLNGTLPEEEQIYMEQPKGFKEPGKKGWVCRLKKVIYGMKQAGRIWNKTLDNVMRKLGFARLKCEACIYYRKTNKEIVIAGIHINDFLSIANLKAANEIFKDQLRQHWTILDLGILKHIVGIRVK